MSRITHHASRITHHALATLVLMLAMFSCKKIDAPVKEELTQNQATTRLPTERGCSQCKDNSSMSIEDWLALDPEEQKQLWLDKLDAVKNDPNINTTQANLISSLIDALNNMGKGTFALNTTVQDLGLQLAQEFSETDFRGAFISLEPYALSGVNSPMCSACYNDIQNPPQQRPPSSNTNLPRCNCDWTCGQDSFEEPCRNSETFTCCIETSIGCGFFFLFRCDGYEQI